MSLKPGEVVNGEITEVILRKGYIRFVIQPEGYEEVPAELVEDTMIGDNSRRTITRVYAAKPKTEVNVDFAMRSATYVFATLRANKLPIEDLCGLRTRLEGGDQEFQVGRLFINGYRIV